MGVPPQVLAMLQAQQDGGLSGPSQGASGPPVAPQGPSGGGDEHAAVTALKQAMAALRIYEQNESDPEDKAVAAKVYALLTQILAKDQKESDQATGASPAVKYMRTASQGGPTAQ